MPITWAIAAIGSLVLLKVIDVVIGLRASEEDEYAGLDLSQNGEQGYILEEGLAGSVVHGSTMAASTASPAPAPAAFSTKVTTA